ncbi:TonB-dependent receptor domain-containing protein [Halioxenophilus aromaticivorans]|uniref:TonB-dependent receptor n=1 Tax=Halioxenophilus aromaticivorans TaxID=1306992 RepID=A0AAV3TZG8_9ALTE
MLSFSRELQFVAFEAPSFKRKSLSTAVSAIVMSVAATTGYAQTEVDESTQDQIAALEEIVVTGTLIRGAEVAGSQTIGISADDIVLSGAATSNELLGSLPQVSNFFNQQPEQDTRGAARNTLNRPNLRNLPGINDASGATTLVLVDGHRMAPMGIGQSSFDPDFIPGIAIERVEVITDGGSSLYGADAVGGVINFITKRSFDGVQVDFGYDFGDEYGAWDASILAGTSWEDGNGYIAYSKSERDAVLNRDVDWAKRGNWNEDGTVLTPQGVECISPVGSLESWNYLNIPGVFSGWTNNPGAGAGQITALGEPCDADASASYIPEQNREWLFASVTQDLNEGVAFDLKAHYGERRLILNQYPLGDAITGSNPNDLGLTPDTNGGSSVYQLPSVGFSYGANPAYRHQNNELFIQAWGLTPELTIDLEGSWQLRNTMHYGRSNNYSVTPESDRALALDYVQNDSLDPANIAGADAAVINDILDFQSNDQTIQEMFFVRMIADGDIVEMPAGMLRAAVGVEFSQDRARKRQGDTARGTRSGLLFNEDSRDVKSVYAELSVPVLENLNLSLSVRNDDYSDFGQTTNPNIGFTYEPAEWISIYGHWGESFNAPTILDRLAEGRVVGFYPGAAPGVPDLGLRDPNRTDAINVEGSGGDLKPQTAEIYAFGVEVEPVEGLMFTANYYEIDFMDLLGSVDPTSAEAVRLNPSNFIFNPTQEQLDLFLAQLVNGEDYADIDVSALGVIVDRRISNTESAELKGLDFGVSYYHNTDAGTFSYSLSGNKQLDFIITSNGVELDQLEYDVGDLTMAASLGWERKNMRAHLNFRYSEGFNTSNAVNQSSVDDYLVTDLLLGYEFQSDGGFTDGLSLNLRVSNLFDEEPPMHRRNQQNNYAFWTEGRLFKLGISKSFN